MQVAMLAFCLALRAVPMGGWCRSPPPSASAPGPAGLNRLTPRIYSTRGFDEQPGRLHVMLTFRCYFLDANNHIRAAEVIEAKALGEAIEKGLALLRASRHQSLE